MQVTSRAISVVSPRPAHGRAGDGCQRTASADRHQARHFERLRQRAAHGEASVKVRTHKLCGAAPAVALLLQSDQQRPLPNAAVRPVSCPGRRRPGPRSSIKFDGLAASGARTRRPSFGPDAPAQRVGAGRFAVHDVDLLGRPRQRAATASGRRHPGVAGQAVEMADLGIHGDPAAAAP